jgi:two-component system chemotaxis sensor kinase CheA
MDLRRFLDLYVSETDEHVRMLHRSLLALETDAAAGAVDEAFRAAHTVKGLSAAMGYAAVAALAHGIEDRLDGLRAGLVAPGPGLVDELLEQADRLEAAIAEAVATAPAQTGADGAPVLATGTFAGLAAALPDGAASIALVRLRADAPIKSARAMIVMRALAAQDGVLGSEPASFADDFGGEFAIFFTAAADLEAAEAVIAAAGEVQSVEFVTPAQLARAQPVPATGSVPASVERQVRVDAGRLDTLAEGIGELSVLFGRVPPGAFAGPAGEMFGRMGTVLAGLQRDVLQLRMVPLREAFDRLPRVVRDAARTLGREVDLAVVGDDVELDRAIIDEIGDPLVHLLRNAVDHGIEAPADRMRAGKPVRGHIQVVAERERSSVRIAIADDGRGVDAGRIVAAARAAGLIGADSDDEPGSEELFRLMSHPGLSTAEQVSAVSGRGVGMDVVMSRVRALGGAIDMQTERGRGTTFVIRLPVTRALAQALRVRIGSEQYAIPITHIAEAVDLTGNVDDRAALLHLRGERVPLVRLRQVLQVAGAGREETAVIAMRGERKAALAVDELIGREQILVKEFDAVTGTLPHFSGATLLADGRPALVLDPLSVI